MTSRDSRFYFLLITLMALGCAVIVFHHMFSVRSALHRTILLGCIFGTVVGQLTLASAWAALAPSQAPWRRVISALWLVVLFIAVASNFGSPLGAEPTFIVMVYFGVHWLLVQIPLRFVGARLRHVEDGEPTVSSPAWQFGTRRLMMFTAIVGICLGVGRLISPSFSTETFLMVLIAAIFLAAAAVSCTLPLMLAALRRQYIFATLFLVLLSQSLLAICEAAILGRFGAVVELDELFWLNVFGSLWVLAFSVSARIFGYRLAIRGKSPVPQAT